MAEALNHSITFAGIDIGKNSFHIVGLDGRGAIVLRQKWSRGQVEARFANMPPCLIGMEACVGAHHLSRRLQRLGHDARLMPARYVRPYSKGQKNDFRDAEAIAEAVQRPTMKFVGTHSSLQAQLCAHGPVIELKSATTIWLRHNFSIHQRLAAKLGAAQRFAVTRCCSPLTPEIFHHCQPIPESNRNAPLPLALAGCT